MPMYAQEGDFADRNTCGRNCFGVSYLWLEKSWRCDSGRSLQRATETRTSPSTAQKCEQLLLWVKICGQIRAGTPTASIQSRQGDSAFTQQKIQVEQASAEITAKPPDARSERNRPDGSQTWSWVCGSPDSLMWACVLLKCFFNMII